MERTEYLEMCQKCAILPKKICGIINQISPELIVSYNGIRYYPYKYELSFTPRGDIKHTAILHSLFSNSVQYAELQKVIKDV